MCWGAKRKPVPQCEQLPRSLGITKETSVPNRSLKQYHALRYHSGKRNNAVAKRQYLAWRAAQVPPLPMRCDNPSCRYYSDPLIWNGSTLPLILEHHNGVNTDNRPTNLRLLCPNCDSQNATTRGGANARRVRKSPGGFALVGKDGLSHYVLVVEAGSFTLVGSEVSMRVVSPESTSCKPVSPK
jgi:hypothetical protein